MSQSKMIERKINARTGARAQINRRRLLTVAGYAAGALVAPSVLFRARAAELKPVTLTLDWIYQGPNAGFMVALDRGFYREAGLDVAMTPGRGSASTAQLIASKAAQFGFSDGYVLGNSVARGMALKNIGGIYRRNPAGIMVLSDSDIKTPKDLEGKTVGLTAGSNGLLSVRAPASMRQKWKSSMSILPASQRHLSAARCPPSAGLFRATFPRSKSAAKSRRVSSISLIMASPP
jgi:hypothetical protein